MVQKKVVNSNENFSSSWLTHCDPEDTKETAQHIPLANWFIKKYSTSWSKNHPKSSDFQYKQHWICLRLAYLLGTREETLELIALVLDVNPILLLNDPSEEIKKIPDAYFPGNGLPPIITYRD